MQYCPKIILPDNATVGEFYESYKSQILGFASHTGDFTSEDKQHEESEGTGMYMLQRSANLVC